MFDSQESRVNRSQGLKRRKKEHSNLGLAAAQCNSIEACAYSLSIFTVHILSTVPYCTWYVILTGFVLSP